MGRGWEKTKISLPRTPKTWPDTLAASSEARYTARGATCWGDICSSLATRDFWAGVSVGMVPMSRVHAKGEAAGGSFAGAKEALAGELLQDLGEEVSGDVAFLRNLLHHGELSGRNLGQENESADCVFGGARIDHRFLICDVWIILLFYLKSFNGQSYYFDRKNPW